tara:strand:- start:469 stop:978 length:510 start_codon:yes stop_codon:yes gene_type:complete
MNYIVLAIIIFIAFYIILSYLARVSSKKIASTIKKFAVYLSLVLAAILTFAGKYIFSLPFLFVILSGLKIKGLTALQMFQLWRLVQFLKNSGKYTQSQFNKSQGSSSVSTEEAYKLLGLKKGCTRDEVLIAAKKLQQKIHPDMNRDVKTERLSQLVNEATDKILKTDFT